METGFAADGFHSNNDYFIFLFGDTQNLLMLLFAQNYKYLCYW